MNPELVQVTQAIQQAFVAKGKNTAVAEGQVTPAQLIDAYAAPERRPRDPTGDRPVQANTGSRYSNIGAAYGSLHCAATLAQRYASHPDSFLRKTGLPKQSSRRPPIP